MKKEKLRTQKIKDKGETKKWRKKVKQEGKISKNIEWEERKGGKIWKNKNIK